MNLSIHKKIALLLLCFCFGVEAEQSAEKFLKVYEETEKYLRRRRVIKPELSAIGKKLCSKIRSGNDVSSNLAKLRKLRRKMIFSHPDFNFNNILINRTPPGKMSHNGDQHLARHARTGKGITILENWKSENPKERVLFKGKMPEGSYRSPDIHFSGKKFLFSFTPVKSGDKANERRYFLYEGATDGSWVRQLTGTKRDGLETWGNRATCLVEDTDPCYLADDNIIFISTRSQTFGRCHGGRYNPAWVLYRCDKNGDNIRQLSYGNENEYDPSVVADGRVVFSRWEYNSRHEMFFHMLWSTRPDGTGVANYFGNDMIYPMMITQQEQIPKSNKIVALATGHHSYSTGTVIIIDTNLGENGEQAITRVTPETGYPETPGVGWPDIHYSHPFPINDKFFLVSRADHTLEAQGRVPKIAGRGIYLIDVFGGRELIYEDEDVASLSPIPIRPKKRPRIIPSILPKNAKDYGTIFIQNVYDTRNDPDKIIKPGSIKSIRVNALGVQPRAHRPPLHPLVSVEMPRRVIGTVPVNPDGSVLFRVPARESIHLQALDKYGKAILSERTFWYVQPGEFRSCIGCHEKTGSAPASARNGKILKQKPRSLTPPAGPRYYGGITYMRTIQPVLDRYCISCHGLKSEKGGVNLIHDGEKFPKGALSLIKLGKHHLGSKGYMSSGGLNMIEDKNISRPYQYLAAASKLPEMILKKHGGVKIDRESYHRIIQWLDQNAPIYGDLYPNRVEERKIDSAAESKLRAYIRAKFGKKLAQEPIRALINVAQPTESRILMMPLSKSGGGWGQIRGWSNRKDSSYVKMSRLVKDCIVKSPNENVKGWEPTHEMGGGEKWVIEARKRYLEKVRSK